MVKLRVRARRMRMRRRSTTETVARYLRTEQIGGLILLGAAAAALAVANSPLSEQYARLSAYTIGPGALHLDLSLAAWATDGLLTIFFVVAGLEFKRELVVGELRDPRRAMLPIVGALGGMIMPALVFLAVAWGAEGAKDGWAVPVATDIAFALAVLALTAKDLPPSLRVFLLTLAIVDDLGAILLIAVLFSTHLALVPLIGSLSAIGVYALLQRFRVSGWWLYLPLGITAWALMHASGIHATIAGVAIGLVTRVKPDPGEDESPAVSLEHVLQPISAGICVPVFAFFAAGISFNLSALGAIFTDRVALGVIAGLVVGKTVGVFGGAFLAVKTRLARLPSALHWRDLAAVSVLTGCGFTVSLLIAELAFDAGEAQERVKGAVLIGSLLASLLASLLLRRRVRAHAKAG